MSDEPKPYTREEIRLLVADDDRLIEDDRLLATVDRVTELENRLEDEKAAAAAMRRALEKAHYAEPEYLGAVLNAGLSSNAGKALLEEVERLRKENEHYKAERMHIDTPETVEELAMARRHLAEAYEENADLHNEAKKLSEALQDQVDVTDALRKRVAELEAEAKDSWEQFCDETGRAAELETERDRLRAAIEWALGEPGSDFADYDPPRVVGRYWWRTELRKRAGLTE